jgi:hypothetical protein
MVDMYIAVAVAYGFGILTYWWGRRSAVEPIADHILTVLEEQGYIKTKTDANGDKELIKVT